MNTRNNVVGLLLVLLAGGSQALTLVELQPIEQSVIWWNPNPIYGLTYNYLAIPPAYGPLYFGNSISGTVAAGSPMGTQPGTFIQRTSSCVNGHLIVAIDPARYGISPFGTPSAPLDAIAVLDVHPQDTGNMLSCIQYRTSAAGVVTRPAFFAKSTNEAGQPLTFATPGQAGPSFSNMYTYASGPAAPWVLPVSFTVTPKPGTNVVSLKVYGPYVGATMPPVPVSTLQTYPGVISESVNLVRNSNYLGQPEPTVYHVVATASDGISEVHDLVI